VKEGHGKMEWASGDMFEGEWKAGVIQVSCLLCCASSLLLRAAERSLEGVPIVLININLTTSDPSSRSFPGERNLSICGWRQVHGRLESGAASMSFAECVDSCPVDGGAHKYTATHAQKLSRTVHSVTVLVASRIEGRAGVP